MSVFIEIFLVLVGVIAFVVIGNALFGKARMDAFVQKYRDIVHSIFGPNSA